MIVAVEKLQRDLRKAWSPQTAQQWTANNPAAGQCNVTALVVQDLLGGDLLRTPVAGSWHYYNQVQGARLDCTAEQFSDSISYKDQTTSRADLLASTKPAEYNALKSNLNAVQET